VNHAIVIDLARNGLTVALMVSLPILAVSLFVGLSVSVFQALTQVQEMTLTFLPKVIMTSAVILFMGSWMLTTLVRFTHMCLEHAAHVLK
jgi:flagellar biosynthetic protein FliQ